MKRIFIPLILLLAANPLAGQGFLIDAGLEAVLRNDPGQAEVRIRYRLRPEPADTAVPVAVLPLAGVQLVEMRVTVAGDDPVPLVLRAEHAGAASSRLIGSVRLPAGSGRDEVLIDVYYRVIGPSDPPAFPRRIELPVIAVLWPPEQAVPGTFAGTVSVHPGLSIRKAFPADLARGPSRADRADGGLRHTFDLPVTPAFLAFTLTTQTSGPGLDALLDVSALMAVLLFGLIGWRRFRAEM